jgi:uncharacterized protein DUF5656
MSAAVPHSSPTLVRPRPQRPVRPRLAPAPTATPVKLGTRYLGFLSACAVIIGLAFKSELLAPNQVWQATAGLVAFTTAGLMFLHARNRTPIWFSLDYYVCPALAVIAAAAFSMLASDWRLHAAAMAAMGLTIYTSSYVDLCRGIGRVRPLHRFLRDASIFLALLALFFLVLQSELPNAVKFVWIFFVSLLSGYRSFRLVTQREGRAMFSAFITAQMVTALAFGMVTYLNQGNAYVAVVLAFAWYANQGFILHALDDSLTRRVFLEYGLFAVICIYLVALALLTR